MALAIPPKLRELDIGVMAADHINQKTCDDLIELHKNSQNLAVQGKVGQDNSYLVDMNVRQTEVFVIHEKFTWVDELIVKCAVEANKQFNFNLTGLLERPQLLKYTAPSQGYDWHLDVGLGDASTRKISISILLNDDYKGGDLAFFTDGESQIDPDKGTAVAFPSYLPHRVTPLTEGTRWSLVCWIAGEPFR